MRPNPERDADIRRLVTSGLSHRIVAAAFNLHTSRVSQIAVGLSRPACLNMERDAEIRRLVATGLRHGEVAAMFGISAPRVAQIVNAKDDTPKGAKVRRCLSCSDDFASSWAGERICATCKRNPEWQAAVAFNAA